MVIKPEAKRKSLHGCHVVALHSTEQNTLDQNYQISLALVSLQPRKVRASDMLPLSTVGNKK
jgi:hypothetical protein